MRSGPRDALLADSVNASERGRAFGLNRAMDHLGAAIGPLLASGLIALGCTLRTTFATASVFGLMAVLFLRLRDAGPPVPVRHPDAATAPAAAGSLRKGFTSYLMVCVMFAFGNSSDAFLLVRAHELGFSAAALPILWLFHRLVKSIAAIPGGALSDRHSRAVVVAAGWGAYAITYVGFAFANARWQIVALFLAYALYHGLAEGAERAIIADMSEPGARGRAFGLYHGLVGAAALPAGLATGLCGTVTVRSGRFGLNAAYAALASFCLAWLTFAGPLRRTPRP